MRHYAFQMLRVVPRSHQVPRLDQPSKAMTRQRRSANSSLALRSQVSSARLDMTPHCSLPEDSDTCLRCRI